MSYNTGQDERVLHKILIFPNIVQSVSVFYKVAADALYGKSENLRRDLGIELEQKVWENTVPKMAWQVKDIKSKCMHYKVINRCYWTPVRLKKLGLIHSSECWKCKSPVGICPTPDVELSAGFPILDPSSWGN